MNPVSPSQIGSYTLLHKIGVGQFSVVHKAHHNDLNKDFACKILQKANLTSLFDMKHFEDELKIQLTCCHPNIVALIDLIDDPSFFYVFTELCESDLQSHIAKNVRIEENNGKVILKQLLQALSYVHSCGFAHRDIKPANILFDKNGVVKLCDFGFSVCIEDKHLVNTQCGTIGFNAPEVVSGEKYDGAKADVWSCGIIFYTMLVGRPPWNTYISPKTVISKLADMIYPSFLSQEAISFIKRILRSIPEERPTIDDMLSDNYLLNTSTPKIQQSTRSHDSFLNVTDIYNIIKDKNATQLCLQGSDLCRRQRYKQKNHNLYQSINAKTPTLNRTMMTTVLDKKPGQIPKMLLSPQKKKMPFSLPTFS
ncbi:CAMK family protein kinase [Tritrichomonas foetus]|uniref:CAMK family protein kinase n=1 Tax=Tritrichomonas foetus TaxID=1144522 RepID=A0A1J4KY02_9EUKA|nr:CAMK family protein kinase [Tritrichomonas foetus]|eukprot:OHT15768.1 CAMK family protein kinase [Tritrichomonas foetus]